MAVHVTALVVGAKTRPSVEKLTALVRELWDEELVAHQAVVSVGPITSDNPVTGAEKVGAGRRVHWKGTDLPGLLAAIRSGYEEDLAVRFDKVDLDAFEPAEEEEYEDVEDDAEDDGVEDDDAPAAGAAPAPKATSGDDGLGEFELVSPSLCLYSVRAPVDLREINTTGKGSKKQKAFGPRAVWMALDGEDMGLLVDDLGDCWLVDVVEETLGRVEIGQIRK
ncbi:MAG: hypothetical protein Q8P41_29770 [Pseudomonadota bacterium]|nr:hypothetical protein [Pseudomonadota bacterium]